MKKAYILFVLWLVSQGAISQCPISPSGTRYEPYIYDLQFSLTSPWGPVGSSGIATFTLGNCGPTSMNGWNNGSSSTKLNVIISPNISYTVLGSSLATGVTAPSGSFATKFSWVYNSSIGTLTGTQIADIDAGTSGTISFPYTNIQISTSANTSPCDGQANCQGTQVAGTFRGFNGMVVNIQPPSAPSNSNENGTNNNLGRYEYTETKLAIESLDLQAKLKEDKKVELNWSTANEYNTLNFDVERQGVLNHSWGKIGTVAAAGNSTLRLNYTLVDDLSDYKESNAYYRIKTVDIDGSVKYSEVRRVSLLASQSGVTLSSYPSPFRNSLKLEFSSPREVPAEIKIFDILGMVRYENKMMLGKGYNLKSIQLSNLPSGHYLVTANIEGEIQVLKTVKLD